SLLKVSQKTAGVVSGDLRQLERGYATEGSVLYVNVGADQGVKAGDVFIVHRSFEPNKKLYRYPKETKKLKGQRAAIGEMIVVKTGERASTALVTYAADAIALGDSVERR